MCWLLVWLPCGSLCSFAGTSAWCLLPCSAAKGPIWMMQLGLVLLRCEESPCMGLLRCDEVCCNLGKPYLRSRVRKATEPAHNDKGALIVEARRNR